MGGGRWIYFLILGGATSVSSGIDAGETAVTVSSQRILDFHVISKVLSVDTAVAPPEQNAPHIRLRAPLPRQSTKDPKKDPPKPAGLL